MSQGVCHQTYASTEPTSRHQTIFILSIYKLYFIQTLMSTPCGWPTRKSRNMSEF